jgi:hypothetical protein
LRKARTHARSRFETSALARDGISSEP